jgi:hypothetical protein
MAPPHAGARLGRLTPRGRPRTPAKGSTVLGVGALLHGRGYQFLRDIGVPLRRRYELECDVVYIDGQFVSPNPERLLLDSRVVDLPMAYNPIFVTLSSLKPLFFNGLKNEF